MECVTSRLRDGNEIAIILSNATQLPLSRRECRIRSSWEFTKLKLDLIKQTLDAARGSGSVSPTDWLRMRCFMQNDEQRGYHSKIVIYPMTFMHVFNTWIQHFPLLFTEKISCITLILLSFLFKLYFFLTEHGEEKLKFLRKKLYLRNVFLWFHVKNG